MHAIFGFGERRDGYDIPVLNERAVRAGAGILFFAAVVAFMNAWLTGNFQPTRVFVIAFLTDFTVRIFVNPRFSPSLILGQWFVRKQQPEYVGAPQKRFAWAIGFLLGLSMLYLLVINHIVGPINLFVCATCLILLFFETAFGICLGCMVYNLFNREKAQLCPGGVCETTVPGAELGIAQGVILAAFAGLVIFSAQWVVADEPDASALRTDVATHPAPVDPAEAERCKVPEFAKAMGHEEMWKRHNNCL